MTLPAGAMTRTKVDRYCRRHGITLADFSRASGVPGQTISHLLRAARPKRETIERIVGFIAAHPDGPVAASAAAGPPEDVPTEVAPPADGDLGRVLRAAVQAEARGLGERRTIARMIGSTPVPTPSVAERIATEMVAQPNDAIAHVQRRWPQLWDGVLREARAAGKAPGAMLFAVIERGLGLEVTCG